MTDINRRELLAGLAALPFASVDAHADPLLRPIRGRMLQGGHLIFRTLPGAAVSLDGQDVAIASGAGLVFIGFDRDTPASTILRVRSGQAEATRSLYLAPGRFEITRVDGLPPQTVEPTGPALLARIAREAALKAEGFSALTQADDFAHGFHWPLATVRVSSAWGAQRLLNGTAARPHYGIDLAAPEGTLVLAPAAGTVTLAERDLHFEGGLVLLEHGQGLVSAYLHLSEVAVSVGQRLAAGSPIGRVGATGRATGPHLCWRLRWRDRQLDPSLLVT